MIAEMLSNKRLNPIVTELFIRGRKINISLELITHLISTHYFVIKVLNK